MKCPQHYLTKMQEVILFYNGLDVPTRQILDSRGVVPTKTVADAKTAIQEMAEYSQKWHNGTSRGRSTETSDGLAAIQAQLNNLGREIKKVNEKVYAAQVGWGYRATAPGYYQRNNANPSYQERRQSMEDTLSKFMSESAKRHEENSNLIKEIRATTDAAIRNQGASIKTLEIQIGQMSKVLQERGFGSLPNSTETNPRDQVKSISTTIEADSYSIRQEEGNYEPKFMKAYGASHINNTIPRKEKDLRSFTLPCIINNTCFDNALVDLGASVSVMPLSTYLNLGLGKLAHTRLTVELADRTVKYPKGIAENVLVVEEENIIFKSVKPASSLIKRVYILSLRERIELDLEARLMGETLVLNRSLDPFLEDYIELNDLNEPLELRRNQRDDLMPTIEEVEVIKEFRTRGEDLDTGIDDYPSYCDSDKKFHNSIMKDKMVYKGNNVVGAVMNVPIFVGTFSVVTDFAVLEDMDAYRDEGMGDVSEKDKKNGISHAYQKLKGFYKGALNIGPDYIRNVKTEEWLIRGHISVHEME
ncbi:mitochondrial proton/calcium exchanger protein-like protein isoform X1 [Tanacetum coccineum]|uniref:Mitochondrial proton/calcium exchanger protein-like protein isoform X1 n=1 Tax=Tanacetum coccineum TaxID=301880 RepID=A0ABQ5B9E3_9ASTR